MKQRELKGCKKSRSKKRGLAITLARAIIASPHYHEEQSSWRLQVYQEHMTGATHIIYPCSASLGLLRATERT
jgi:hypothetical protein